MWLHTIKPSPNHTMVSYWCKSVVGHGWNHWGEMNPEQRTGAIRHVLLKTSSFSSVVYEPDASAFCYIEEKTYPALGKVWGDCISALALAYSLHLSNTIHLVVTLSPFFNKQRIQPERTDTLYLTCVEQRAPFALSSFSSQHIHIGLS